MSIPAAGCNPSPAHTERLWETCSLYSNSPVPSGSLWLDFAIGSGLPRGQMVELFGPPGSGKTTLALQAIARLQRRRGAAGFLDLEHSWHTGYASALGVREDGLIVSQPRHGEQALEIALTMLRSGLIDLLVVDSVAAWLPELEQRASLEAEFTGLQNRLLARAASDILSLARRKQTAVLLLNQVRGTDRTDSAGGAAIGNFASVRIELSAPQPFETAAGAGVQVGFRTRKNAQGGQRSPGRLDLFFGQGVRHVDELAELALAARCLEVPGRPNGGGVAEIANDLGRHPAKAAALETAIYRALTGLPVPVREPILARHGTAGARWAGSDA